MPADHLAGGERRIGATTGLAADLACRRETEGRPIRIGLIGSDEMVTAIETQCRQMTGITVAAIANATCLDVALVVPSTEVCAVVKKDLSRGERLDAIGGCTSRGPIMTMDDVARPPHPLRSPRTGKVTTLIRKGAFLTYDNRAVDGSARIVALRQRQAAMLKGH